MSFGMEPSIHPGRRRQGCVGVTPLPSEALGTSRDGPFTAELLFFCLQLYPY